MAILYLKEVVRVFDPRHECVGSILGTKVRVCTCKKEGRFEFLFLFGLRFLHQGFSHDSYDLGDYSRHIHAQISKHQ